MKVEIESDRIRLTAENSDENDSILSIMDLMAAARYPGENQDDIPNDSGCHVIEGRSDLARNYCCIPLPDDAQAHAVKTGGLVMEPTEENIAHAGPKTAAVLREMKQRNNSGS